MKFEGVINLEVRHLFLGEWILEYANQEKPG